MCKRIHTRIAIFTRNCLKAHMRKRIHTCIAFFTVFVTCAEYAFGLLGDNVKNFTFQC